MKILQDAYEGNLYIDVVLSEEEIEDLRDHFVLALPLKMGDQVLSLGVRRESGGPERSVAEF
jgi:hypothetical protein